MTTTAAATSPSPGKWAGTDMIEQIHPAVGLAYREVVLRLVAAVAAGGIIGAEREWRQKRAGLRTNVLVAVGAAVFCLIAASIEDADRTRIAAQIASGIGFLGAGVILRDGLNVRGLDTAATLWCAAAAGATAGSGLYAIALTASAIILAVNVLFPRGVRSVLVLENKKDVDLQNDDAKPSALKKMSC